VLLFAGSATVMAEKSLSSTPENIRRAIDVIDRQRGGGGTQLLPALKKALSMSGTEGYSRNIVIATDGYVSVEEETFDLIRNRLGDANMFAFGIGSSVNRHLIEGMARVGMGEPFIITQPEEAVEKAKKFRELIQSPVLTNIEIDFGKFHVFDVEPPAIPDVLADRPVIVFGKYHGGPKGSINIQGITGELPYKEQIGVASIKPYDCNSALRYLFARHRIALLADYNRLSPNDERIEEVTSLGLTYNLLTAYTSFIAVDSQKRHDGRTTTVKQPLPLPQGVSDYAVGNGSFAGGTVAFRKALMPSNEGAFNAPQTPFVKEETLESKRDHEALKQGFPHSFKKQVLVALGEISVSESLSKQEVQGLVEKQIDSINICYVKSSESTSGLTKEAAFTLAVDANGRVTRIQIDKREFNNTAIGNCIIKHFETLRFPPMKGTGTIRITISFIS